MANLSQEKRKKMIKFLDELKSKCNDDKSIGSLNEIRNHYQEKITEDEVIAEGLIATGISINEQF